VGPEGPGTDAENPIDGDAVAAQQPTELIASLEAFALQGDPWESSAGGGDDPAGFGCRSLIRPRRASYVCRDEVEDRLASAGEAGGE